jgi:uncharacterized protein involved in outer membrane biogenesis
MKKFLLGLVLLIVSVGALATALLTDANIKKFTERWLSTQLGRAVVVEGEFSAELGIPLRLTATSVRLANPDWVGAPDMATAGFIEAAIDPWTIPGDAPFMLEELVIKQLKGDLISDEQGRQNWDFTDDEADSSGANFRIRQLEVSATQLNIQRSGFADVPLVIDQLVQTENSDGLLDIKLAGKQANRDITAKGELGPFKNLLDGTDIRFAIEADVGTLKIEGVGMIDDLSAPQQPELSLQLDAPDANEVADMFGLDRKVNGDIKLTFQVLPADTGVEITAGGRWGRTNLDLRGSVSDLVNLDGLKLVASGGGPNLKAAIALLGIKGLPEEPFKFSGNVSRNDKKLDIRELDLTVGKFLFQLSGDMNSFPSLNNSNLELSVKGEDVASFRKLVGLPGVAKGTFALEAELERGESGQDEFRAWIRTELGKAAASGTLGTGREYAGTQARFRGDGKNLNRFGELIGLPGLKEQPFNLNFDVVSLEEGGFRVKEGSGLVATETRLLVSGTLGEQPLQKGTQLDWQLSGLDVRNLVTAAGLPVNFPARQIEARGKLQIRPADFVLTGVDGTIGKADFTLSGQVGRDEAFRGSDLRISLKGPELERMAFLVDDINLPSGPFQVSGRVQRMGTGIRVSESSIDIAGATGKVDGELSLPVEPLAVNFDIEIEGPDVSAFWEGRYEVAFGAQPFVIDARGTLNEERWDIQNGAIKIGGTDISIQGNVRQGSGSLQINAVSPEMADIGTLFGVQLFPGRQLQLSATLERKNNVVRLDNFLAKTNKGDLAGEVTYTPGSPPRLDAKLTSQLLDISWALEPLRTEVLEDKAATEAAERNDGRLIPDWALPLEAMRRFNLDISIAADEILRDNRDVRNAYARFILEDGALKVEPWRFEGQSGTLDASFRLQPTPTGADLGFRLEATDLISELFTSGPQELEFMPKGDWLINLTASGKTVREIAGNLNGTGRLNTTSGRVLKAKTKGFLFGDLLSNIASTVNAPAQDDPYTEISCAVFPFRIKDGKMESYPSVVVQTDKLNILSRGDINLRNEQIDLSFNSKPRRGVGISAGSIVNPFVRIGGTLAEPAVALDKSGAALTGGAAFFTAGLSLIAQAAFNAAWRSPDPCGRVLEESEKRFAKANGKEKKK